MVRIQAQVVVDLAILQEIPGAENPSQLCQGVPSILLLSSDSFVTNNSDTTVPDTSARVQCSFLSFNGTRVTIQSEPHTDTDTVRCTLPIAATTREILQGLVVFVDGEVADTTWFSGENSTSPPSFEACLKFQFSGGKGAAYCLGPTQGFAISGATIGGLLTLVEEAEVACSFHGETFGDPFIDDRTGVILCQMPPWRPWSPAQRAVANTTTLLLSFGNITDFTASVPRGEICLDVSSHGVDSHSLDSNRQSGDESHCFPWCCKRENVSIEFQGGTVEGLAEHPERLRCLYQPVNGDEAIVSSAILTSTSTVQCGAVSGWRPGSTRGDFSNVVLQVLDASLSRVELELASMEYFPTTANQTCIGMNTAANVCIRRNDQVVSFDGPTMDSILAHVREQNLGIQDVAMCTRNSAITVVPEVANRSLRCTFSRQFLELGEVESSLYGLSISLPGLDPLFARDEGVTVESCIQNIQAMTSCSGNSSNFTSVLFSTNDTAVAENYKCVISISDDNDGILAVIPAREIAAQTFNCSTVTGQAHEEARVQIQLGRLDLAPMQVLEEAKIGLDSSCIGVVTSSPTTGETLPDGGYVDDPVLDLAGLIVAIIIVVGAVSVVASCVACYCHRKRKDKNYSANNGEAGSRESSDTRGAPTDGDYGYSIVKGEANKDGGGAYVPNHSEVTRQ